MLRERLGKELLLFDGGMGTQLQEAGLKAGDIPEVYNIEHPDIIIDIHKRYLKAGSDFITTNTFGCNPIKMKDSGYCYCDLLKSAINNAKKVPNGSNICPIGPISKTI